MKIEKIKKLDGQTVTLKQLRKVEESENVINIEDNGLSGLHYNKHWYSAFLVNNEEIQLYTD